MIYLDNAATTQPFSSVVEAMRPFYLNEFGNPGTRYTLGIRASKAVADARHKVAELIGCNDDDSIIFTSGGSEGNSLVIRGLARYLKRNGKTTIIVSAVEHDSVLKAAMSLTDDGFSVLNAPVLTDGCVDITALRKMLEETPNVGLVSVMNVNNEVGSINPVGEIANMCHQYRALFHTDCVQAAGCVPIYVDAIGCDFATVSSHKIHGPKGVGAVYARGKSILAPIIYGGDNQEFGLRGGTENVPGIVGFGEACSQTSRNLLKEMRLMRDLKIEFYFSLMHFLEEEYRCDVHINGCTPGEYGKILNIRVDGVDAETLLYMLDAQGIYCSAGSACTSQYMKPSHVLTAMGLSELEARSSIRLSVSPMNTVGDMRGAANQIAECVRLLKCVK